MHNIARQKNPSGSVLRQGVRPRRSFVRGRGFDLLPFRSRDEEVVTGRGLYGAATSEQFSEGGDGGALEAADGSVAVGPGQAPLSVQPSLDDRRRLSFTQSNLSSDSDQQLVHAVIQQR